MLCFKLQTAMDQLHMHFASAIHNTAFTIVLGYVELCAGASGSNFQKRQYPDLCKVPAEFCRTSLCLFFFSFLNFYFKNSDFKHVDIYTYARHTHNYKVNMYRLYNGVKKKKKKIKRVRTGMRK